MSLSRILVLLTSVICLVRADDKPRASDRPKECWPRSPAGTTWVMGWASTVRW